MNIMKQMTHFTIGWKAQARMLFDTSTGGIIRTKNEDEVKHLTERICHNEYRSISDQTIKLKGVLELDSNRALPAQLKVISKQLLASTLVSTNVSQVQTLRRDFYGEGHENEYDVPKRASVEAQYENFQ